MKQQVCVVHAIACRLHVVYLDICHAQPRTTHTQALGQESEREREREMGVRVGGQESERPVRPTEGERG